VDVKDFEYLAVIADEGSVTKAANKLFLTQPAVSKFIQEKEKELGVSLFNRIGKQLAPTYAGEKCIEAAREILKINARLNNDITQIFNNDKNRIRLGLKEIWVNFFFDKIYPEFRKFYPDIILQIHKCNSTESLNKLDNGVLDIAIVTSTKEHHLHFSGSTLQDLQFVLGVNKNDPILSKAVPLPDYQYPYLDLQYLKDTSFIMRHTDPLIKQQIVSLLKAREIKPPILLETNSLEETLNAINHNYGVSFLTNDAIQLYLYKNLCYLSISDLKIHPTYLQVKHSKGVKLSPVEEELIDIIIAEYEIVRLEYMKHE